MTTHEERHTLNQGTAEIARLKDLRNQEAASPETLREWAKNHTHLFEDEEEFIVAAADAWEFTLDDAAGMVRQLEADREQLREYGEEIASLRTRPEAAREGWDLCLAELKRREKRLEAAEKAVPTTWLDPLLSGPDAIGGLDRCDGRVIEALLLAIKGRIAALAGEKP